MRGKTFLPLAASALVGSAVGGEIAVFESKWSKPGQELAEEWATKEGRIEISPNGARTFLAGIREKGVRFHRKALPPHKVLHLEFDLIVRGNWDGGSGPGHHDRAVFELADGRVLLASSFRTYAHARDKQSYPFHYNSGRETVTHYGAAEQHSLGYLWTYSSDENWKVDTIYHMDWYVPHEGEVLAWDLYARLGEDDRMQDMWIGIDRLKIGVLTEEHQFSDEEWSLLLAALDGPDAIMADQAVWQMLRAPSRARAWLAKSAVAREAIDPKKLAGVISGLTDEELKVRRASAETLLRLPAGSVPKLEAAREALEDDKGKNRLGRIIEAVLFNASTEKDDYWRIRMRALLDPPAKGNLEEEEDKKEEDKS